MLISWFLRHCLNLLGYYLVCSLFCSSVTLTHENTVNYAYINHTPEYDDIAPRTLYKLWIHSQVSTKKSCDQIRAMLCPLFLTNNIRILQQFYYLSLCDKSEINKIIFTDFQSNKLCKIYVQCVNVNFTRYAINKY